ncbi:hypothetical protein I79_015614 [Cricetulus griseus]|uniref:Uncharacterized protein n=1 Tax=Cricetulus griseus TaxID=10029 RepID=G3HX95_CRIGR|nr:hypothetical protein I79_015614 [Cricetulus griseus]
MQPARPPGWTRVKGSGRPAERRWDLGLLPEAASTASARLYAESRSQQAPRRSAPRKRSQLPRDPAPAGQSRSNALPNPRMTPRDPKRPHAGDPTALDT